MIFLPPTMVLRWHPFPAQYLCHTTQSSTMSVLWGWGWWDQDMASISLSAGFVGAKSQKIGKMSI